MLFRSLAFFSKFLLLLLFGVRHVRCHILQPISFSSSCSVEPILVKGFAFVCSLRTWEGFGVPGQCAHYWSSALSCHPFYSTYSFSLIRELVNTLTYLLFRAPLHRTLSTILSTSCAPFVPIRSVFRQEDADCRPDKTDVHVVYADLPPSSMSTKP